MGFKLGRVYVLEFEGTGLEGAVIKLRSPSINTIDSLIEMNFDAACAVMLDHLVEWNLETATGEPLPGTLEALKAEAEPEVPVVILRHWYRAARGLSAPLEPRSTVGATPPTEESPAPSIPMETQ